MTVKFYYLIPFYSKNIEMLSEIYRYPVRDFMDEPLGSRTFGFTGKNSNFRRGKNETN